MARRIRHLKTVCVHYLVLEEDGELVELPPEQHEIKPKDWPKYSGETFPQGMAETQAKLDAEDVSPK
jgi:hypothetical protein